MAEQLIIAITGAVAIFLTQSESERNQRYACLVGLIGQPFWLLSTWQAEQWGMFALSVLYTIAWIKGVKIYWLKV